jgi:hypothetical protein
MTTVKENDKFAMKTGSAKSSMAGHACYSTTLGQSLMLSLEPYS